jgi:hypothetical protein
MRRGLSSAIREKQANAPIVPSRDVCGSNCFDRSAYATRNPNRNFEFSFTRSCRLGAPSKWGHGMRHEVPASEPFEPVMWAIATMLSAAMISFAWLS